MSPEALGGGPLAKLRDGDVVRVCAERGELTALVDDQEWDRRENRSRRRRRSAPGANCSP